MGRKLLLVRSIMMMDSKADSAKYYPLIMKIR